MLSLPPFVSLRTAFFALALVNLIFIAPNQSAAQTLRVLYDFTGQPNTDFPMGLTQGSSGEFYGAGSGGLLYLGGEIFKIDRAGNESVLYSFCNSGYCTDGNGPNPGLVLDEQGNVYGTTSTGGTDNDGVVFKIDSSGNETVLYSFQGVAVGDGAYPYEAGLVRDTDGNLYGTTSGGGVKCTNGGFIQKYGCGTIFKVSASGQETIVHRFHNTDGEGPQAGLVRDQAGSFYGTAEEGGTCDGGVVFKLGKNGTMSILHSFCREGEGDEPQSALVLDAAGNLYGTLNEGLGDNLGAVYKVTPDGEETILHQFGRCTPADGCDPGYASLVLDSAGDIYGVTGFGGTYNYGTVFKIDTKGNETLLHSFTEGSDGGDPSWLARTSNGTLYGTTYFGGIRQNDCVDFGCGVIFQITPAVVGRLLGLKPHETRAPTP